MPKSKYQRNVKFQNQNWILKRVQNDTFVVPGLGPELCPETNNVILNLFQDQGLTNSGSSISASHLSFGFDLTFELLNLEFLMGCHEE